MPTLKINGIEVEVEHGMTVLEAARFLGIPIPTLCHEDALQPYGACRLCLVEVSNGRKTTLQASCCLPADDGLVVFTHSARVERARKLLAALEEHRWNAEYPANVFIVVATDVEREIFEARLARGSLS
ncbi:MAG: (2Fe-2S)-binding protein [Acidobacteriia bacterium]|nr:(2Fe-2S)-binding protein [Terriglobia bacterium]